MNKSAFGIIQQELEKINDKLVEIEKSAFTSETEIGMIKEQIKTNCEKLDKLPLKIKQEIFPQLVTEIRNCVRDELNKKF